MKFQNSKQNCVFKLPHTSSIPVAEVRKPPDVTQTNHNPCHSQNKLCFAAPVPSLLYLSFDSGHTVTPIWPGYSDPAVQTAVI